MSILPWPLLLETVKVLCNILSGEFDWLKKCRNQKEGYWKLYRKRQKCLLSILEDKFPPVLHSNCYWILHIEKRKFHINHIFFTLFFGMILQYFAQNGLIG